ncbi:MAG: response regulator [Eubacterium sp.]|nr:response regulator [Eubacterium sp.]
MSALGRVAFIKREDGLVVGSIINRLLEEDITPVETEYELKRINMVQSMVDAFLVVLDGDVDEMVEITTFLRDASEDAGIPLIGLGEKVDCDIVEKMIPGFYFRHFFERPFDQDAIVARVKKLLEKKQKRTVVRKKILIVDDDPYFAGVMRDWLKQAYEVTVITEGIRAVDFAMKNKPDLILLDYEMPVTSGPYVFECLKQDIITREIPVVFLTGVDDRASVEKVLSLRPKGYFLKSTSREQIENWLKSFFKDQ